MLRRLRSGAPVAAFFIVGLAWVLTSPPGTGIDEPSHFVRMVGVAHGQLIGDDLAPTTPFGDLTGTALARVNSEGGAFRIPGTLPPPKNCNAGEPEKPFACEQNPVTEGDAIRISHHAKYLPGAYLLPALLSRGASTTWRVLLLGRFGFLVQNTVFFGIILVALRALGRSFTGAAMSLGVLATTPLLAFLSGTLAPSATEILASVAYLAALIAGLTRHSTRWLWIAVFAGVSASWSRDLGTVCIALFSVVGLLSTPGATKWLWSRRRSNDLFAVVVLAIGVAGAVAWQLRFKVGMRLDIHSTAQLLRDLGTTAEILRNSIGLVGWLDVRLDVGVEFLWIIGVTAATSVLWTRAKRRIRVATGALAIAYIALTLYLIGGQRAAGFGGQARFTLALPLAAVVLLITHDRVAARAVRHGWFRVACIVVGLGHFSTLLIMAQRHTHGLNQEPFDFSHVAWRPTGGWPAMLVLITLASVAVAALPAPQSAYSETLEAA